MSIDGCLVDALQPFSTVIELQGGWVSRFLVSDSYGIKENSEGLDVS